MEEVKNRLLQPGSKFEIETVNIRGIPTKTWKNAPNSLADLLRHSRSHGDTLFTIYDDDRVTYEGFFRAAATLAKWLQDQGVKPGDRVAHCMRNLPEWPVVFFAVTSIKAIVVPLNAWWTGQELAYGLEDSGAKALLCDEERYDRISEFRNNLPALEHVVVTRSTQPLEGALTLESIVGKPNDYASLPDVELPAVDIQPDDDATIFYTSGTTGKPKGALGTHRNLCSNIITNAYNAARAALRRGEEPPEPEHRTTLTVIPLFHVTACSSGMMTSVFAGNTFVFMYKWDPVEAFQLIEKEKVNVTGGVPTIAWQLIEHPERKNYDLSSLEAIAYGGAPAAPDLVAKIYQEFGALPGTGWGMTETMATVTGVSGEDYFMRPASCGAPTAVADLKIMSPDGSREMPIGDIGELWARGPMIVKEYWNKPDATAGTFIDGWVRTGDMAYLDDEGFCYISGRAKEMIIRGGENIYPAEVENVLYDHPAVTDAALIGIPHRTLGEEPAAVVHLAPGTEATEDEIKAWVKERIAAFKTPVRVIFLPTPLPRNANGKIMKPQLKSLFEEDRAAV